MLSLSSGSGRLVTAGLAGLFPYWLAAQSPLVPQGGEYALVGSMPGDQVFASVAFNGDSGYVVWEDNITDGDGSGVSARRLNSALAGQWAPMRVNGQGAGDQQRPQVAMLKDGGAVIVWQGGPTGFPKIYARFLKPDGTFWWDYDHPVSEYPSERQEDPQVAVLANGDVVIVWTSLGQDGSQDGVFARRFAYGGWPLGPEFCASQTTQLNQRTPRVAALPDGKFLVIWISERVRGLAQNVDPVGGLPEGPTGQVQLYDVNVFARKFEQDSPVGNEFCVDTLAYGCANPTVAVGPDGRVLVAWSAHVGRQEVSGVTSLNGWDVMARGFAADGTPAGIEQRLNERTYGDQYLPVVAPFDNGFMAVWTSLNQDGSREGVYGRAVGLGGTPVGSESKINSTTVGPQKFPTVASDGQGRLLVVWSGAVRGVASFDLFAQRYATSRELVTPSKPFVSALSSSRLHVTWPALDGLSVATYELYMDGAATPVAVQANYWVSGRLDPGSTHTFRLAYVLGDGRHSPLSETASGTTWGVDDNFDGLPDDWQAKYWGPDPWGWPSATLDSDGDGASNLQEFLAGTHPADSSSVLRLSWSNPPGGSRLHWNTEQGYVYQVQVSADLKKWENLGPPRFAPGRSDSIPASQGAGTALYRVIRVR